MYKMHAKLCRAEKVTQHACVQSGMQPITLRGRDLAKCSYRPTFDCLRLTTRPHAVRLFPAICSQNVVCISRAIWWRCDSCEYLPFYVRAGTLHTCYNRNHAALGTQSAISCSLKHDFQRSFFSDGTLHNSSLININSYH